MHQLALDALTAKLSGSIALPPGPIEGFLIEVLTNAGQSAVVDLRLMLDTVEIWHAGRLAGVFVRDELRAWFADPDPRRLALVVDEVALSIDRLIDANGRVAISLPDVLMWALDPQSIDRLHERL